MSSRTTRRSDPATRRSQEDDEYADYESYLDQEAVWPSLHNGVSTTTLIDNMPPQYAASALGKLMRWGSAYYGTAADEGIHTTKLVLALANRALSGNLTDIVDAVLADLDVTPAKNVAGEALETIEVIKTLAAALDSGGEYDAGALVEHAFAVARFLDESGFELRRKA